MEKSSMEVMKSIRIASLCAV